MSLIIPGMGYPPKIQRAGASVVVNPNGSVRLTMAPGQTANAFEVRDSAGALSLAITKDGKITNIGGTPARLNSDSLILQNGGIEVSFGNISAIAAQMRDPANVNLTLDGNAGLTLFGPYPGIHYRGHEVHIGRGTNPQKLFIYNTFTDPSNYERGGFRWSSNVLEVFTESAGTGLPRSIRIVLPNEKLLLMGNSTATGIDVGDGTTANRWAYVDLIGDTTYTDYGLRIARGNTGPNTDSFLAHRGTGGLILRTEDAGAIVFATLNTNRWRVQSSGHFEPETDNTYHIGSPTKRILNLYAAGKLLAAGGLGVGNSAAATTLGSVIRKMEVFDASGNSLGFIPIYDSIT